MADLFATPALRTHVRSTPIPILRSTWQVQAEEREGAGDGPFMIAQRTTGGREACFRARGMAACGMRLNYSR